MKSLCRRIVVAILTYEAKVLLRRCQPKIIAVTGSVGKTSVKDAVFEVLQDSHHVRKNQKSYNSEFGVPLTILGLESGWNSSWQWFLNCAIGFWRMLFPGAYPELLVLEMGVDAPGDMARLTAWIKPDVAVLTRLPDAPVHAEFFDRPEDVAAEKLLLLRALKSDGVLVFNNDDELVRQAAIGVYQKTVGFSRYSLSDVNASADQIIYENGIPVGTEYKLTHNGDMRLVKTRGALGVQQAYTHAAAIAVGLEFGVRIDAMVASFETYVPPPGRMRLVDGIKDTLLIDDSYNSSPVALERSLAALKDVKSSGGRKIAVLGDMSELGEAERQLHLDFGAQLADSVDVLVTVGRRARWFAEGALNHGMDELLVLQYESADRAGRELQNFIEKYDVLLVKGSQCVRLEKIVLEIMAEPDRAEELLVRQDVAWEER